MKRVEKAEWAGSPDEFKTPLQTALAFEGLRSPVASSVWESLAEYVEANVHLCESGERPYPKGYAVKTEPSR